MTFANICLLGINLAEIGDRVQKIYRRNCFSFSYSSWLISKTSKSVFGLPVLCAASASVPGARLPADQHGFRPELNRRKGKNTAAGCEFSIRLEPATADLPDQLKLNQRAALKCDLATPATCTSSTGKSTASPRRNVPCRSGRDVSACTIFGKRCVWISCSGLGSASSSIVTCGKKGGNAQLDQSCRSLKFFSHKENNSRTNR